MISSDFIPYVLQIVSLVISFGSVIANNLIFNLDKVHRDTTNSLDKELSSRQKKASDELSAYFQTLYEKIKGDENNDNFLFETVVTYHEKEFTQLALHLNNWIKLSSLKSHMFTVKKWLTRIQHLLFGSILVLSINVFISPDSISISLTWAISTTVISFCITLGYKLWLDKQEDWVLKF